MAQRDIMFGEDRLYPGTIAILTYHALDNSGCVLSTPPSVFAEQMRVLHELGVSVVPLRDVRRALDGGATSKNLVAITFDDGFRSVYEYGLPVLQRYGFTATVFLVTDYCGKTNSWPKKTLPSEFGGDAGDYQLAEEEDANGQTCLTLLVHPEVGELDQERIRDRLKSALAQGSRGNRFMARVWQNAGSIRIRRAAPYASPRGKILPLHILSGKASAVTAPHRATGL